MPALIEYRPGDSLMHRLNPATKILWTLVVLILCFLYNSPFLPAALLAANLAVAAASGVWKEVLPVIRGLFVFALVLIAFQIFFVTEGQTLFYLLPFYQVGRITDTGLIWSATLALRMMATVSTFPILLLTTPVTDLTVVLVDRFKVPFKYSFMFTTALHFIPVLFSEMDQILQAQVARGYQADNGNPGKKLAALLPLAVPLLVSSVKKIDRMAISMEVRGFGSGPRTRFRKLSMGRSDYIVTGCFALALIMAMIGKF